MLAWSHFVVACLCRDSQFPQLPVQVRHKLSHPCSESSEVVVVLLLALGASCTEEGASCKPEILSLFEVFFVDQEILLLCAHCCYDPLYICLAKKGEDLNSFFADGFHTS